MTKKANFGDRPKRLQQINALFETALAPLLEFWHLTALDVGARDGFTQDLAPIARCVDAIGFEPDADECARLNTAIETRPVPWRSLRYLPTAIGEECRDATLHLCTRSGCTSLLEPDIETARLFSRADYYAPLGELSLQLQSLDDLAELHEFCEVRHLKLDVQGYEEAVIAGAKRLLSQQIVAVRSEVSFLPLYKGQPLFRDIDAALGQLGFAPMLLLELHEWRRLTKCKLPKLANGALPWSRGQMVHGDVLFMKSPEHIMKHHPEPARALVDLALIALCFGCIDHAFVALSIPATMNLIAIKAGIDPLGACAEISQIIATDEDWVGA